VQPGDVGRVANCGQVDRQFPGEKKSNVVVDGATPVAGEFDPQGRQALVQGVRVGTRQVWKALDTRRERISLTAQALLLWMCSPPSVRAAPGVVKPRTEGWVGLP
jgi:hypothetical protein